MKSVATIIFLLLFSASLAFADGMPIVFDLEEPDMNASQVLIQFYNCPAGTGADMTGHYYNGTGDKVALEAFKAYSLEELTCDGSIAPGAPAGVPAVVMDSFTSGQIYVVFGSEGLDLGTHETCCNATACADCVLDPDNPLCADGTCGPRCYQPSFQAEGKRYQNFEADVVNGQFHGDLTYIDFGAIALSIDGMNATHGQYKHQRTIVTSDALVGRLASAAAPGQTGENTYPAHTNASDPTFARVLAPGHAFSAYHDWTYCLQTFMQGETAWLKGWMGKPNNSPDTSVYAAQYYDYNSTVDADGNVTLSPNPGSGQGGIGAGNDTVITIDFADLNTATGIYGTDVAYTFNGTRFPNIQNDITGRVVGDFVAGICFGFIGSPTEFNSTAQGLVNKPIGQMYSTQWWGGPIDDSGTVIAMEDTPGGQGVAFSKAQSDQRLYHVYSDKLLPCSSAYGFGLQDRIQNNLMYIDRNLDPECYLRVTIGHDVTKVSRSYHQSPGAMPVVLEYEGRAMTREEFEDEYGKSGFEPGSLVNGFGAEINPDQGPSTFMYATSGLTPGVYIQELSALGCRDDGSTVKFGEYASGGPDFSDGSWWITDEHGKHMAKTDSIEGGELYQVHFVIADGGRYDFGQDHGAIASRVVVGKGSGSSSSGCAFNPSGAFGAGWLLMLLAGFAAYGVRRLALARER